MPQKKKEEPQMVPFMHIDMPVTTLKKLIQAWDLHTEKNIPCGTCLENPDCRLNNFFIGLKESLKKDHNKVTI